ncbi:PREDICTED: uncharacterized protein LOC109583988 [Amphimedon queenslandica]|nr:PREDICTED: uncharacterized protein LOC109583988 [Amphimedon queenslandica]|eukprot:XP_019855103.1 PREDICTED: uncharacterized protein LOC109583988 [Amphimedon queenslandica]
MQSGEISTVQLQVESFSGEALNVTRFDFYNYSESYSATLNLSRFPFSDNILIGRLAIRISNINVTIEPSIITVSYNPQSSYAATTTPVIGMASSETVYITSTPTIPSQSCTPTVYTSTLTKSVTGSCSCTAITNTSPSLIFSKVTVTVENSASCSSVVPTTQPNQSSLNSSVVVGGVMGYVIFLILGVVGTVGGFFWGKSTRQTIASNNGPVIISNYKSHGNAIEPKSKNQTLPLPMLPRPQGCQINDNGEAINDEIYTEMDNFQEEKKYENPEEITDTYI